MNSPLKLEHCPLDAELRRHSVTIEHTGDWVQMVALVETTPTPRALLRTNAANESRWRAVLNRNFEPRLVADLRLGEDPESMFIETRAALFNASVRPPRLGLPSTDEMTQFIREAEYECTTRRDNSLQVSLAGAPPEGNIVIVETSQDAVTLRLDFETIDEVARPSLDAIAKLILRAASIVRLAKPLLIVNDADRSLTPRFEVRFHRAPSVALVADALGAFTILAHDCAAECSALGAEKIAAEWLARCAPQDRAPLHTTKP